MVAKPMVGMGHQQQAAQQEVAQAFETLLAAYSDCDGPLSAWESHCLALAMVFARYGYFDKALIKIEETLEPPFPLPTFAEPEFLTIDEVRWQVGTLQRRHEQSRRYSDS
jgi:hypothetical protein